MFEAALYKVDQPMAISFSHAAFRRKNADSVVLLLQTSGITGIGECAPRKYVTGETSDAVLHAAAQVDLSFIYNRIFAASAKQVVKTMFENGTANYLGLPQSNSLECLFELAILDFLAQSEQCSVARLVADALNLTTLLIEETEYTFTHVLNFETDAKQLSAELSEVKVIKIKADRELKKTLSIIEAVRYQSGPVPLIIIDANMSWSIETTIQHIKALSQYNINFFEEPINKRNFIELAKLQKDFGISIMLDESLCYFSDAEEAVKLCACDAFNIRISKCGGLLKSIKFIQFARKHKLQYQIGVQVAEVGPLIAAERQLALLFKDFFTIESGQHDRFFPDMVITPVPEIDRNNHTVLIKPVTGLGVSKTSLLSQYTFAGCIG
ncbi:enolase C-terminal domain-like protein [Zooshikella harenae]|uniref:Mandelate racemase/muconate lactonizing enzyme C-terminal domain-containing protein n=1 Tax=Zooshikella harenae TaxID=2827238 RepID=A0ABS5ZI68_9GAMM|nr:enolase C-terminal domain-like protein [Zooshikella harenae]MBU2713766.1 hypothetical protein [Zooshikella harenae]